MAYEKIYTPPYPGGWHDLPTRDTLVTAEILENYDEAFEHIEDYLEDNPIGEGTASDTSYDNTESGLEADNVQEAIDELAQTGGGGTAATTTYDNTSSGLEANNVQDAIDELAQGGGGGGTASSVTYDNTESGLDAENVQDAIDELAQGGGDANSGLTKLWESPNSPAGTTTGTMELSEAYTKYDYLIFSSARSNSSLQGNGVISTEDLDISRTLSSTLITIPGAVGSYGVIVVTDSKHFTISSCSADFGFRAIYGYRSISSEVKNNYFEKDLIAEPVNFTSLNMTVNLLDSLKNYDELIIRCKPSSATDYSIETRFTLSDFVYGSSSDQYITNEHPGGGTGWFTFYPNIDGDSILETSANYCILDKLIGVKKNLISAPGEPVQNGLIRWYDAINNTGIGHSNTTTTWVDLTGNGDATIGSANVWKDKYAIPNKGQIYTDFVYNASTPITIEAYIEICSISNAQAILSDTYQSGMCIQIRNLLLEGIHYSGGSYKRIISTEDDTYIGRKCLVTFTYDSTTYESNFYIDGELIGSDTGQIVENNNAFYIGRSPNNGDISQGIVHDVRIYNRVLSQKEIRKNCAYDCQKYNNDYSIPLMSRDTWNALPTLEKKNYGLVSIQDDPTGYRRGILVNGLDFEPSYISLFDYSTELNHIFTIDETGMYLLMMAIPYGGSGSITLPQSATILSTVDEEVGNTTRHVTAYIARLHAGDVINYQMTVGNWGGRIESIIKLEDINTVEDNDFVATSDNTTTYTLPNDNDLYLVYGLAVSRTAVSRDDTSNTGGEQEVITGDWGVNSVSRVAVCKGNQSPNYSFYGYDGGFSAIVSWKIS